MTDVLALPLCNGNYQGPCCGVYMWPDGVKYGGEISHHKKHGYCAKYVREYRDGNKYSQDTMFWIDGGVWVGQWKDDGWVSGDQYTEGEAPSKIMTVFNKD